MSIGFFFVTPCQILLGFGIMKYCARTIDDNYYYIFDFDIHLVCADGNRVRVLQKVRVMYCIQCFYK